MCKSQVGTVFVYAMRYVFTRGPHEGRSGLRQCVTVLEASLQTLVRSRAVSQPAVTGSPIG